MPQIAFALQIAVVQISFFTDFFGESCSQNSAMRVLLYVVNRFTVLTWDEAKKYFKYLISIVDFFSLLIIYRINIGI